MSKKSFCQYVRGAIDEAGVEAVKVFVPLDKGYINYNIIHSVRVGIQCDTWRLGATYYCNESLEKVKPLTRAGAEWEMAIKIKDRPDFIGGYAHGDEALDRAVLNVDDVCCEIDAFLTLTEFENLSLEVWSRGFDPSNTDVEALVHYKKITVNSSGVRVQQRVDWLGNYELDRSYMAMFAPLKTETNHYYSASDRTLKAIGENVGVSGFDRAGALYLNGKTGFTFCLKVEKYLSDIEQGHEFLISDNGGVPYNKMYFALHHNGCVKKGDFWETVTGYSIEN